jgi:acyl phosphate:glycerol-3-phosphate acyltransferase
MIDALAAILLGYLLGSLPWGYWLPRLVAGIDVRAVGSGGTGAANVWRSAGFKLGLAVALLDIAKGFAAALVGIWLGGDLVGLLAGIAATVGHWRPLFLGLARGGKIVATTGGVALALAPLATLAVLVVWIAVFLATRYTSIASMTAGVALPIAATALGTPWPTVAFTAGAAVAIVFLHRANIGRLLAGTENRFRLRRGGPPAATRSGSAG